MTTEAVRDEIPNYFRRFDAESLFASHPPPEDYFDGMFKWSEERVREHQESLFKEIIAAGWKNPFYASAWAAAGVRAEDIRSLSDLTKLPIVSSDDFKDSIAGDPPFGTHQRDVWEARGSLSLKVQSSGGTTGMPRATLFGAKEWEVQAIQTARALYSQGVRPGDVMQIPATLSLANLGWCYFQACFYYLGVVPLTTGSGLVTSSKRQVEMIRSWGTSVLGAFPEYLLHLADVARQEGLDPRALGVRRISTYLGPDTEGVLRAELETAWDCDVYDNYGSHEIGVVAFECEAKAGLHINEDTIVMEVCDSDTGVVVADGLAGDLVATSLHRQYPPLIRYNMKDRVRLLPSGPCSCGGRSRRMDHFLGRSDDMVKLRGVNIYPMQCLTAVTTDTRTTGEWLCVVEVADRGAGEREEMTVKVEAHVPPGEYGDVERDLAERLKGDLGVRVHVEAVGPGALKALTNFAGEGKVRRLLDLRPGYERS